eukprot:m.20886 g.20886  ORF g.20886 m.20886 type:complete len:740 (+) comp5297_c0_seq1:2658-4877(+)
MSGKRRSGREDALVEEEDQLTIIPLGAGQEVGRSCHLLKYKGFTIMMDCGIHPGLEGLMKLPYFNLASLSEVDIVLITHFHLDHCGALPYLLERTTFKGKVFMTHATRDIFHWNLIDQVRVSALTSSTNALYTEEDVRNSIKKITAVSFHQSTTIDGVTFTPYYAGHVLGACMYEIEIAGVRILYTGDYSREKDRHLMTAELPPHSPDVLLIESTFGTQIHSSREERENRLKAKIQSTVLEKRGKVLIPAFALGRVQELLLILDDYWQKNEAIRSVPLYYASNLAHKCMYAYKQHVPNFKLRHVQSLHSANDFETRHNPLEPCVVLASPGMLQNGLSRELFESWAGNSSNCVILAGYSVEGTLAHHLKNVPKVVESLKGEPLAVECDVQIITFAAHVDFTQNLDFIHAMDASHVILVHGNKRGMKDLKKRIERSYEGAEKEISIHDPKNTVAVVFHYRGEKMAKIMGSLVKSLEARGRVCGVLVSKNFNNMILAPDEIKAYTNLMTAVVNQKQIVPFDYTLDLLTNMIASTHGMSTVQEIRGTPPDQKLNQQQQTSSTSTSSAIDLESNDESLVKKEEVVNDCRKIWTKESEDDIDEKAAQQLVAIEVMECVRCSVDTDKRQLVIEWSSSPEADMWADAILAMVMQTPYRPEAIKQAAAQLKPAKEEDQRVVIAKGLFKLLSRQFGKHAVSREDNTVVVSDGARTGKIHLSTMKVSCDDIALHRRLFAVLNRLRATTSV